VITIIKEPVAVKKPPLNEQSFYGAGGKNGNIEHLYIDKNIYTDI